MLRQKVDLHQTTPMSTSQSLLLTFVSVIKVKKLFPVAWKVQQFQTLREEDKTQSSMRTKHKTHAKALTKTEDRRVHGVCQTMR